jgi:hypothetical protein
VSVILDVAVGLVFLYLLLALVATTVQELIASVLKLRAKNLYDAIEGMLQGEIKPVAGGLPRKRIVEAFYEHPLIKNLCKTAPKFEGGKLVSRDALPSYIPSKTFTLALLDVLRGDTTVSNALGARDVLLKAGETLETIANNDDLKRTLKLVLVQAGEQADKLDETAAHVSKCVETLFNDRMARASGWYKRQAQWIALLISLVITGVTNADTIHVADRLWTDDALRNSVVQSAIAYHDAQMKSPSVAANAHGAAAAAGNSAVAGGGAGNAGSPATMGAVGVGAGTTDSAGGSASAANTGESKDLAETGAKFGKALQDLEAAGFPIGWPRPIDSCSEFLLMLAGWVVTAFAVSLGSNFWFDVLSKVLQIRGGGPKVSAVSGRVGDDSDA